MVVLQVVQRNEILNKLAVMSAVIALTACGGGGSGTEVATDAPAPADNASPSPAPVADSQDPTTPTNLVATVVSGARIDLAWSPSSDDQGVTKYIVSRCTGADCAAKVEVAETEDTRFSDTGLTPGVAYSYTVTAVDGSGRTSATSLAVAALPADGDSVLAADRTAPSTPSALTSKALSASQVSLSWTGSTDNVAVTGYRVERCLANACTSFIQISTNTSTSFTASGLTASTQYAFRIRAVDAAGNVSAHSNVVYVATLAVKLVDVFVLIWMKLVQALARQRSTR